MRVWTHRVFVGLGSVALLAGLALGATAAQAKAKSVALFVQTVGDKPKPAAQRTGAILNWVARAVIRRSERAKVSLLDRGLFFSRSQALSARRWREKAAGVAEEGYQNYLGDPAEALRFMYRAARFYEYAYTYAMHRKGARKSLLYLGCLLYRKGNKRLGRRRLTQGILIHPTAPPPTSLNAAEQQLVQAVRCQLGKAKSATMVIQSRSPASEVYVNGYLVGFGSLKLSVPPGEYYVKVTQDGYRHWGRRIRVKAGRTKNVRVYLRHSPRNSFYKGLCKKLMASSVDEQLTDELKKVALTMQVKQVWIGCFQPSGAGTTGKVTWMSVDLSQAPKGVKGSFSVPAGLRVQWNTVGNALKKIGLRPAPTAKAPSSLMQYPGLVSRQRCINPDAIQLSPLLPPKQKSSGGWLVSVGDICVVYTKYGFRLQGKVLNINGDDLTMQVAASGNPPELRKVKINKSMVKLHWGLGKPQHRGFRIGERVVVQTSYNLSLHGVLISSSKKGLRLKTRQGVSTLPWSMIRSVIKRDR